MKRLKENKLLIEGPRCHNDHNYCLPPAESQSVKTSLAEEKTVDMPMTSDEESGIVIASDDNESDPDCLMTSLTAQSGD
jgi:hypothetical protein